MRNRKIYFISLVFFVIVGLSAFSYINSRTPELINYWGTDYLNEIYIHDYSTDKFFIQLFFLSLSLIPSSIILLAFNIKRNLPFYSVITLGILFFVIFHIGLSINNTDRNLSELGAIDLGTSNTETLSTQTVVDETTPSTTETIDNYVPEPINNTQFVLVVFETEEPTLFYQEPIRSVVPGIEDMAEFYTVSWKPNLTVSKVLEFDSFTIDDGYMLMDEIEKFATIVPEHFSHEVNAKISRYTERDRLLLNKTKITKRYYLTFTTYTEASIKRQELLKPESN
ncbi:hypothetical protein [Paenimyroides aestuarii]|uniref:Uncharacterized protein n=1 Tax=Paenimyroides aestuarii TaxID=2968490 RepID=A0ABY5NS67_9FLAO|nr:hypothetical protein [Paenimyroides aestuarii]UUV21237.1 hypothetical protein NPX36_13050 [Paenimyroides aestuarii]